MSRKLRKVSALALESGDGLDFSDDDDVADPTYNIEGEKNYTYHLSFKLNVKPQKI